MRRMFGPSQRPISGLLPLPISLSAALSKPHATEQPLNPDAPCDPDMQPKAKVPAFSTPKAKAQSLPGMLSEAGEQLTVGNHKSNLSASSVLSKETFSSHDQSKVVALTNRPNFSTPLVKACNPLENCTRFSSLHGAVSSPSGDSLCGGKHQLTERNRDEHQHFRSFGFKN